jgi:hypothetical protein
VIRRKTNRRHMTGDHHGQTAGTAILLVRALDGLLGTHRSSPWSSSLVAYRQMSHRTGSRRLGGMPGVRDDGHTRLRIPKQFLIAP